MKNCQATCLIFHVPLLGLNKPTTFLKEYHLPSIEIYDLQEFAIHEVLDYNILEGHLCYLVDWEGYDPCELLEKLGNALKKIAKFHQWYPQHMPVGGGVVWWPFKQEVITQGSNLCLKDYEHNTLTTWTMWFSLCIGTCICYYNWDIKTDSN